MHCVSQIDVEGLEALLDDDEQKCKLNLQQQTLIFEGFKAKYTKFINEQQKVLHKFILKE